MLTSRREFGRGSPKRFLLEKPETLYGTLKEKSSTGNGAM
jgi:hypothetical protein